MKKIPEHIRHATVGKISVEDRRLLSAGSAAADVPPIPPARQSQRQGASSALANTLSLNLSAMGYALIHGG
jgi:hypothetical protein